VASSSNLPRRLKALCHRYRWFRRAAEYPVEAAGAPTGKRLEHPTKLAMGEKCCLERAPVLAVIIVLALNKCRKKGWLALGRLVAPLFHACSIRPIINAVLDSENLNVFQF